MVIILSLMVAAIFHSLFAIRLMKNWSFINAQPIKSGLVEPRVSSYVNRPWERQKE